MIRAAAIALAAFLSLAPAAGAERRFTVTDFDRIVVEGPYQVTLATNRAPSVSASGSADALDRLTVDVQGRTLRIRANRTAPSPSPSAARAAGPVTLTVSAHDLRSARVAGAGNLSIDRVGGLRVDLSLEGSGRIAVAQASGDALVIGALGSGRVEVAGTVKDVRASIHGQAELDASGLQAERVRLVTDTAGRVAMNAEDEATVTASGIGEVDIAGSPACTLRGASAGQVRCGTER